MGVQNTMSPPDVDITQQVIDELDIVERMHFGLMKQGTSPVWECSNDGCEVDEYRPVLVPGEEDDYPQCPGCHESPAISDVATSDDREQFDAEFDSSNSESMRDKWSDIFNKDY